MDIKTYKYEELKNADLYIDAIYSSPRPSRIGHADDVLSEFINVPNEGGFRYTKRKDKKTIAYIALKLSGYDPAWPDDYDNETGILTYYGDNKDAGSDVEKTSRKGNLILREMFDALADGGDRLRDIPPILVFQNTGVKRDVRFIGLAVPGIKDVHSDDYFTTIWRSKNGVRFPNYLAKFTVIKLGGECIKREWLYRLKNDPDNSDELAPNSWKIFQKEGLSGIEALAAPNIIDWPGKNAQLPDDVDGKKIIEAIQKRYGKSDSVGFEKFCKKLMYIMDSHYCNIQLTRPWRDGGRDALAEYIIETPTNKLVVECAMEAKCYDPDSKSGVGIKQTSRLISRIKNRQFGIMITTSYIDSQAYNEIKEDGHPILFCTGKDIAKILQQKANVTPKNINEWLDENVID